MSSQGSGFSRLQAQAQAQAPRSLVIPGKVEPPQLPYFEPRSAAVDRPSNIPTPLSLLGIPAEVRDEIWESILSDIRSTPNRLWYIRPTTGYDSLPLVCRQVYHEISHYWRRSIVTQNRLDAFLDQKFSLSKLQNFKSLSIEIPFNMPCQFFLDMAYLLRYLSPFLEHLNIFFIGADAYGTKAFLHGCGNMYRTPELRKLPIDGQGFTERHVFMNVLSVLQNLRSLAIHNPNLPLLQSHIILHKPRLEKLYLECDPRSALHIPWRVHNCGHGLLVPVTEDFPPVKELYISANASIMSVQVISKLDVNLEKLTWICPDTSRQAGSMQQDYLRDTDIILSNLHSNARGLHTLRICIDGAIYESLQAYGVLIGSFNAHVPHLMSLRNLEVHIWSKSSWFGKEVVRSFPAGLERVYLSERLIALSDLLPILQCRYLGGFFTEKSESEAIESTGRLTAINTQLELDRTDYVPLRTGNLAFVAYQYTLDNGKTMKMAEFEDTVGQYSDTRTLQEADNEQDADNITISINEARRLSLLKLNGRLLDRTRNKHLAVWPQGSHVPVNSVSFASEASDESESPYMGVQRPASEHSDIEIELKQLKPPTVGEVRTNHTLLRFCGFRDDYDYFGAEKDAEAVFRDERIARFHELEARNYPVEVEVGHKEHWMCD